ncbi:MAG: hypothetical protein GF350_02665 [Chitinivibrionales bacterium]|nr:hypothetical protein [Chitinivibrionales bacterium]
MMKNEKGGVLIAVVVIACIGTIASMVTFQATNISVNTSREKRLNTSLLNIAEAGKEHALALLRSGEVVPEANSSTTIVDATAFSNGVYSVLCEANADVTQVSLTSTATVGEKSKSLKVGCAVSGCEKDVEFEIDDGTVVPGEEFKAYATVLGAAFQFNYGGYYDAPITLRLTIGGTTVDPWGDFNDHEEGNVNDHANPRTYYFDTSFPANSAVSVQAKAYNKVSSSSYSEYRTVNSTPENDYVWVLRDGDDVPDVEGFRDQGAIADFVDDYIVDGKISLTENQAIYLFEMYTALSGSTADFQDVVVLLTLAPPGADFTAKCGPGKTEAEAMTVNNYRLESVAGASSGKVLKLTGESGAAVSEFIGSSASYYVEIGYVDEDDGDCSFMLLVDDVEIGSWIADEVSSGWDHKIQSFSSVLISEGQEIKIQGMKNGSEYARIDYIDIVPPGAWREKFELSDGSSSDNGATAWSSNSSGGTASVQGELFKVSDTEVTWTSESIDISQETSVDISLDITADGDMESSGGSMDYFKAYYSIDGGGEIPVEEKYGSFSDQSIAVTDIAGSSLQIIIRAKTTAGSEYYTIDNVYVIPEVTVEEPECVGNEYTVTSWKEL